MQKGMLPSRERKSKNENNRVSVGCATTDSKRTKSLSAHSTSPLHSQFHERRNPLPAILARVHKAMVRTTSAVNTRVMLPARRRSSGFSRPQKSQTRYKPRKVIILGNKNRLTGRGNCTVLSVIQLIVLMPCAADKRLFIRRFRSSRDWWQFRPEQAHVPMVYSRPHPESVASVLPGLRHDARV